MQTSFANFQAIEDTRMAVEVLRASQSPVSGNMRELASRIETGETISMLLEFIENHAVQRALFEASWTAIDAQYGDVADPTPEISDVEHVLTGTPFRDFVGTNDATYLFAIIPMIDALIDSALEAYLIARDTENECWYRFSAYNSQARFGYGNAEEAGRFVARINAGREVNHYNFTALTKLQAIKLRLNENTEAFNLSDELLAA